MNIKISASDPLKPVCDVLIRAFPNGVPDQLYSSLLYVLSEEMSFRAVARAIEVAFGIDYDKALNDAYGAQSTNKPSLADVQAIRVQLKRNDYDQVPDD